jgi:cyclopropane-fatty-acyl-phospholipid synthase
MNLNSNDSSTASSTALSAEKPQQRSLFRYPFVKILRRMRRGNLSVRFPDGEVVHFGGDEPGGRCAQMVIHRERFFKRCALYGGIGLGEAYVDGDWDSSDLRAVIEWFVDNIANGERMRCSSQRFRIVGWLRALDRIGHRLRPNSLLRSRRNIAEHYDLGNEFYKLWLDPTMTYSGARFTEPDQTLESAQLAKYEALCQKLRLRKEDHLLEIGCGWGGFSCYAARTYGCRITAVTISEAQFEEAARRVEEAGLADRVEVRLQDYREIEGSFDKIASIEMLEAVGHRYHETYFAKCDELLARDGLLAVQMITVPDNQYSDLRKGADFIQKHIFPGSLLLSVGRVADVLTLKGDLFLHGLEDLGAGYARTLREWHENFNKCLTQVREQGFPEAFIRKWNYYLKYCEAAFASRNISVVQAVYTRPNNHPCLHREDGIDALITS